MTPTAMQTKQSERLTKREMQCLSEIAEWSERGVGYPEWWMRSTRMKLQSSGYVEAIGRNYRGPGYLYGVTTTGLAALKESTNG